MQKFRVSAAVDNKIDYCTKCGQAWLDIGEWDQLNDLGLRESLGAVFTVPWQQRVRKDLAKRSRESILQDRFGSDFERIAEFRAWILEHPQYESALAWLSDRSDS